MFDASVLSDKSLLRTWVFLVLPHLNCKSPGIKKQTLSVAKTPYSQSNQQHAGIPSMISKSMT